MRVMILSPTVWNFLWVRAQPVADHLARRGHQVTFVEPVVYLGAEDGQFGVDWEADQHPLPDGLQIVKRRANRPARLGRVRRDWAEVIRLIRSTEPDVVIGYVPVSCLGPAVYCARNGRPRLVLDCEGDMPEVSHNPVKRFLQRYAIVPGVLRLVSHCICLSEVLACDLRRRSRHVSVIPNGVDLSQFVGQADPTAAWRPRAPIVFVGYFGDWVDYEMILTAARRLPDVPFHLYGDGPCRAATQAAASDLHNVHFKGFIVHEGVPGVLANSLAALIPFKVNRLTDSAFPLKLVEYWAMRRPVICSPSAELKLVAADQLLFASNGDELAERIQSLRGDRDLAIRLADEGYREVLEKYDAERVMDRYEAVLRQVVE